MEARESQSTPRPSRRHLDDMGARSAAEVLGILRSSDGPADGRGVPTGLWKTGWQARSEAAPPERDGRGVPTGLWKTGWDAQTEGAA